MLAVPGEYASLKAFCNLEHSHFRIHCTNFHVDYRNRKQGYSTPFNRCYWILYLYVFEKLRVLCLQNESDASSPKGSFRIPSLVEPNWALDLAVQLETEAKD